MTLRRTGSFRKNNLSTKNWQFALILLNWGIRTRQAGPVCGDCGRVVRGHTAGFMGFIRFIEEFFDMSMSECNSFFALSDLITSFISPKRPMTGARYKLFTVNNIPGP